MRLPVGTSNFAEIIEGKYNFIDKSMFIKDVIEDSSKIILFFRPRRFGKTLNLSMLDNFLSHKNKATDLFSQLKIAQELNFCKLHKNKYYTIFLTLKDIKELEYNDSKEAIDIVISELYQKHRHLLQSELLEEEDKKLFNKTLSKKLSIVELKNSLKVLINCIKKTNNKKIILLIDEYDTPIHAAFANGYYEQMIYLMRGLLGGALKDNNNLEKGIVTGITKVANESIFSGINNIDAYSVMSKDYGQYFGFTEAEVHSLTKQLNLEKVEKNIKSWYNGYTIGGYIIYNPWSIINCLKKGGQFEPYWANTSDNSLIKQLISQNNLDIKQKFELLLQKEVIEQGINPNLIFPELKSDEESIWSLFLYAGYLTIIDAKWKHHNLIAKIAIPNEEVRYIYSKIIRNWFGQALTLNYYENLLLSLSNGEMSTFKKILSLYIKQAGSYFDFNKNSAENVYHVFLLGLVIGMSNDYKIKSNQESGFGRYDIALIPKDKKNIGILLELKTSAKDKDLEKKAGLALKQIKERAYSTTLFQSGVDRVLGIGIAFCGKKLELKSKILLEN